MAVKLTATGFDDYFAKLISLSRDTESILKSAVYDGAAVIADDLRAAIQEIPENNGKYVPGDIPIEGLSRQQKDGLLSGIGIAKIRTAGSVVDTKIGFNGYNGMKTKKYPKGQPNMLIARALMRGTSKRKRYDFVSKAVNRAKQRAVAAMEAKIADEINKRMEE